jgi:hypothetical protein
MLRWLISGNLAILLIAPATAQTFDPSSPVCLQKRGGVLAGKSGVPKDLGTNAARRRLDFQHVSGDPLLASRAAEFIGRPLAFTGPLLIRSHLLLMVRTPPDRYGAIFYAPLSRSDERASLARLVGTTAPEQVVAYPAVSSWLPPALPAAEDEVVNSRCRLFQNLSGFSRQQHTSEKGGAHLCYHQLPSIMLASSANPSSMQIPFSDVTDELGYSRSK